jgi:hypothetical protein
VDLVFFVEHQLVKLRAEFGRNRDQWIRDRVNLVERRTHDAEKRPDKDQGQDQGQRCGQNSPQAKKANS